MQDFVRPNKSSIWGASNTATQQEIESIQSHNEQTKGLFYTSVNKNKFVSGRVGATATLMFCFV